jgi:hypothetical protein
VDERSGEPSNGHFDRRIAILNMRSKPFFIGAIAIGWIGAAVLSCAGPGDSGNLLMMMFVPVVVLASAVGLVWGMVERKKRKPAPRFNTAGLVMNAVVVGIAGAGLGVWISASVWPTLWFRFPKEVPVYPNARHISKKTTTRDANGKIGATTWTLLPDLGFGETMPHYERAEKFYDAQLPAAEKRKDGNNVDYSYVNAKGKKVEISIKSSGAIYIRESKPVNPGAALQR